MHDHLSTIKCRPSWKQCALLIILLSHAVFGSPVVPSASSSPLEPVSQTHTLAESNLKVSTKKSLHHYDSIVPWHLWYFFVPLIQASLEEEDVFGPNLDERTDRKKRLLYEALKKAKQAKLLTLGAASANAAKSVGKSIFKTIATLGIKAIIFNFLYQVSWRLTHTVRNFLLIHVSNLNRVYVINSIMYANFCQSYISIA